MEWLKFENVTKSFRQGFFLKKRQVLFDVTFSLQSARSTGFVGANGSGKTTILKLALGFIFADAG